MLMLETSAFLLYSGQLMLLTGLIILHYPMIILTVVVTTMSYSLEGKFLKKMWYCVGGRV